MKNFFEKGWHFFEIFLLQSNEGIFSPPHNDN